jgi:hypothetical protein
MMDLTPDLTVIHERLVRATHRDLRRRRVRVRAVVAVVTVALLTASAAAAVGLELIQVGSLRISSQPELPASLADIPAAAALAGDPNALACGAGWVAATAVMQSPHDPQAIQGCHTPTDAERTARRDEIIAEDPRLARPLPYWYLIDEQSLATTEGRPGAAAALGPVYIGSAAPLTPAQLTDPANWRIMVSGVDHLRVPAAPLPPETSSASTGSGMTMTATSQAGDAAPHCKYQVITLGPKTSTRPATVKTKCVK